MGLTHAAWLSLIAVGLWVMFKLNGMVLRWQIATLTWVDSDSWEIAHNYPLRLPPWSQRLQIRNKSENLEGFNHLLNGASMWFFVCSDTHSHPHGGSITSRQPTSNVQLQGRTQQIENECVCWCWNSLIRASSADVISLTEGLILLHTWWMILRVSVRQKAAQICNIWEMALLSLHYQFLRLRVFLGCFDDFLVRISCWALWNSEWGILGQTGCPKIYRLHPTNTIKDKAEPPHIIKNEQQTSLETTS